MKLSKRTGIIVLSLSATAAVWWGMTSRTGEKTGSAPPDRSRPVPAQGSSRSGDEVDVALAALVRTDQAEPLKNFAELAASLKALPPEQAVGRIRDILDSGTDRTTGSEFELDRNGNLIAAPTLRTMLLDLVAAIDPAAAAEIANDILAAPTTPDEWALALRNLGRIDDSPETLALLREKTVELIRNPGWQADPSIGYLNAFDVLVHTGATEETPLLSGLIQNKERSDLAHAAFLTLDRLVQRQPVEMLEQLSSDAALATARPEMTAQQFARADLRDDRQRELVKAWLLAPERTATELRSFTGVYPNNNHFVSNNLLTTESGQTGADLAAHDREAMMIITEWAKDAEFQSVTEHLQAMLARLRSFTNSSQIQAIPSPASAGETNGN